jgi:hypothetical protein
MLPKIVSVGPLVAASANNISTSQSAASSVPLILNGTLTEFSANNVATSQSVSSGNSVIINGSTAVGGIAYVQAAMGSARPVVITSAGNDSVITFAVTGLVGPSGIGGFWSGPGLTAITETVTGGNATAVSTNNRFVEVIKITPSGSTAAAITVGVNGIATLDKPRRVIVTSAGNDSAITFALTGTNAAGNAISETLTGGNIAAAQSALDYKTIIAIKPSAATASTVTAGTNGVASSPWVNLDPFSFAPAAVQVAVSGTVNFTVQQTLDDPNSNTNPIAASLLNWVNHPDSNLVAQTATVQGAYTYSPIFARVLLNSGTGSATMTIVQHSAVPR